MYIWVVCELYYRQQNTYKMILLLFLFVAIMASSSLAGPAECTGSGQTLTFGVNTGSTTRFRIMGYSNLTYFGINSIDWVRLLAFSSFNGRSLFPNKCHHQTYCQCQCVCILCRCDLLERVHRLQHPNVIRRPLLRPAMRHSHLRSRCLWLSVRSLRRHL